MAVETDCLRLLRSENDSKRERLAMEVEITRLRLDNETLSEQLRDERAHQDKQMLQLREGHDIALSTLREDLQSEVNKVEERIREAEAQTSTIRREKDAAAHDARRALDEITQTSRENAAELDRKLEEERLRGLKMQEDLREAHNEVARLQDGLLSTKRELESKSTELFHAGKAVKQSMTLACAYQLKLEDLERAHGNSEAQPERCSVSVQCCDITAAPVTDLTALKGATPPTSPAQTQAAASVHQTASGSSSSPRSPPTADTEKHTSVGTVQTPEGLRRSTRRLTQASTVSAMASVSRQTVSPLKSAKRHSSEGSSQSAAKRARTSKTSGIDLYATDLLREAIPPSLNERVADMDAIPVNIPDDYLPRKDSTVGWVKRKMISQNYAVAPQAFTGYLKHLPGTDQPRRAIFASVQQNPGLPSFPGQPGTMIVSRGDILRITDTISIFISPVGQPWWLYVGDFLLRIDRPVTPAEWRSLPEKTRISWANALSDYTQSWEDYLKILVRIARRRNGEPIDDEDVMEDVRLLRRLKGAKPPARLVLQTHDVLEALDRGDETIDVVTLQPHSVDEDLYCELWDIQTGKVVQNPRRQ